MSIYILPKVANKQSICYKKQYESWIKYLTKFKYKPTFKKLAAIGFDHPELTILKEDLKQRGWSQDAINDYKITSSDLIRMGLTETELRYRFLNETNRIRLGLARHFYELESQGYCLYHLSLTYKPQPYELTPERVDKCFIKFHKQFVLPRSLGTKYIHQNKFRKIQPIVHSFLDEHDPEKSKLSTCQNPIWLHHHAIYAVHPDAKPWFDLHTGENKFSALWDEFSPYLTSDLTPCGAMRVLYASKMLKTYPEFLSFPDKWKRSYEKYADTTPSTCSGKSVNAENCSIASS
jgi:hypothetical protein